MQTLESQLKGIDGLVSKKKEEISSLSQRAGFLRTEVQRLEGTLNDAINNERAAKQRVLDLEKRVKTLDAEITQKYASREEVHAKKETSLSDRDSSLAEKEKTFKERNSSLDRKEEALDSKKEKIVSSLLALSKEFESKMYEFAKGL